MTFNPFKLRTEIVPVDRKQELATVRIPDIKEYLVQEYERSQKLYQQNEDLRMKLQEAEEVKLKYDASLVTLSEYKARLDRQERTIEAKNAEVDRIKQDMAVLRDELNNYKIRFSQASLTKEELRGEVAQEIKDGLIQSVYGQKGTLSKDRVIRMIKNYGGASNEIRREENPAELL